jgi:hypothetical protein
VASSLDVTEVIVDVEVLMVSVSCVVRACVCGRLEIASPGV